MQNHDVQDDTIVDAKPAKRSSVTLTAGDMKLTVLAQRKSGDRGETVVITTDAKGKTSRGMTTKHGTFDEAVATVNKVVAEAQRKGWARSLRAGGFKPRPDAFATLPTPPSSKGKR